MLNSALLTIVEDAGSAVLTLIEGVTQEEFRRSRLTRSEVLLHTKTVSDALASIPEATRPLLAEIDWPGWSACARAIADPTSPDADDALWFAITALMPATLMWMRVYRKDQPQLFAFKPESL
ncbi:hypothetical protein [Derxia lacustris]|uniref:hypothetical protein n=1 Tax=Derxia lacustris TaxID=764842 RepID=UPI000A1727F7|nr:hypothetical protein [Derxia lacustris]